MWKCLYGLLSWLWIPESRVSRRGSASESWSFEQTSSVECHLLGSHFYWHLTFLLFLLFLRLTFHFFWHFAFFNRVAAWSGGSPKVCRHLDSGQNSWLSIGLFFFFSWDVQLFRNLHTFRNFHHFSSFQDFHNFQSSTEGEGRKKMLFD